jgi:hypothetical protein
MNSRRRVNSTVMPRRFEKLGANSIGVSSKAANIARDEVDGLC